MLEFVFLFTLVSAQFRLYFDSTVDGEVSMVEAIETDLVYYVNYFRRLICKCTHAVMEMMSKLSINTACSIYTLNLCFVCTLYD